MYESTASRIWGFKASSISPRLLSILTKSLRPPPEAVQWCEGEKEKEAVNREGPHPRHPQRHQKWTFTPDKEKGKEKEKEKEDSAFPTGLGSFQEKGKAATTPSLRLSAGDVQQPPIRILKVPLPSGRVGSCKQSPSPQEARASQPSPLHTLGAEASPLSSLRAGGHPVLQAPTIPSSSSRPRLLRPPPPALQPQSISVLPPTQKGSLLKTLCASLGHCPHPGQGRVTRVGARGCPESHNARGEATTEIPPL